MLIQHRGQFKRLKLELDPLIAVIPKVPLLSSLVFYLKYIYKIIYLLNFYYYPNKIRKGFRVFSSDYSMARFSSSFLASRCSLISSRSLSWYSLAYFSARLKISTRFFLLSTLALTASLALLARFSACLLRRLRIVSGTAGSFASGILLL